MSISLRILLVGLAALTHTSGGLASHSVGAAREPLIRPGEGIGKIALGMTETQVRARLGRPDALRTRRLGFGRVFVEFQYDGVFYVGLVGRDGQLQVHSVATLRRLERTPLGFGVGTSEARLAREYGPRLRCDRLRIRENVSPAFVANRRRECVIGRQGAETIFVTALPAHVRRVFVQPEEWRDLAIVNEVRVRRGALPS